MTDKNQERKEADVLNTRLGMTLEQFNQNVIGNKASEADEKTFRLGISAEDFHRIIKPE